MSLWIGVVVWSAVCLWGVAVSAYRRGHPTTYESDKGPLAWGARSARYRRKSAAEVRRASTVELIAIAGLLVLGDAVAISRLLS